MWRSLCGMKIARRALSTHSSRRAAIFQERKALREAVGGKSSRFQNVDIAQMLENFAQKKTSSSPSMEKKGKSNNNGHNNNSSASSFNSQQSKQSPQHGAHPKRNNNNNNNNNNDNRTHNNNNNKNNNNNNNNKNNNNNNNDNRTHNNNNNQNNNNNRIHNNNNNQNNKNNNQATNENTPNKQHNFGNNNGKQSSKNENQPSGQQGRKHQHQPSDHRRSSSAPTRLRQPDNNNMDSRKQKQKLSEVLGGNESHAAKSKHNFAANKPQATSSPDGTTTTTASSAVHPVATNSQPQVSTSSETSSSHSRPDKRNRSRNERSQSLSGSFTPPAPSPNAPSSHTHGSHQRSSHQHLAHSSKEEHTFVPKPLSSPSSRHSSVLEKVTESPPSLKQAKSGTFSTSTMSALQALAEQLQQKKSPMHQQPETPQQAEPSHSQKMESVVVETVSEESSSISTTSSSSTVSEVRTTLRRLQSEGRPMLVVEAEDASVSVTTSAPVETVVPDAAEAITRTTISDDEASDVDKLAAEKHKKDEDAYNAMHELWTRRTKAVAQQGGEGQQTFREIRLRYQSAELLDMTPVSMKVTVTPSPGAISQLATGLRTVLDRRGVHIVKNAIRGETNYEGTISEDFLNIVQPDAIDTSSIPAFVTSSRDMALLKAAQEANSNFMGSTSSTTGLLGHIILSLLEHRPHNMTSFSDDFDTLPKHFTNATRKPNCVILRRRGKVLAIDSPPKYNPPSNKILIDLGKSLERMFTMEPDHFKNVMVKGKKPLSKGKRIPSEPAMCVKMNSMMVRAQLDCQDGTLSAGVFDLKTRAVLPIRLDCKNHSRYTGYHITAFNGLLYSFEREFFDMVRSTLLKYNLQVRIGQMQGIMVAYHNTQKIFGFEYVPQTVMDEHLYGSTIVGKLVFNVATKLLDASLNAIMSECTTRSHQYRLITHAQKSQKYVDFFLEAIPDNAYADHPDPVVRAHYAPYGVDLLGMSELKTKLKELGVDDKGVRPTLVARLESALHAPLEADIPSREFFESKMEEGMIKHYRLHLYLSQNDNMVESLHNMTFTDLQEEDPQKFALKNGVQVRYQLENRSTTNLHMSSKRYYGFVRDSIEEVGDEDARSAVAAEIPLNG